MRIVGKGSDLQHRRIGRQVTQRMVYRRVISRRGPAAGGIAHECRIIRAYRRDSGGVFLRRRLKARRQQPQGRCDGAAHSATLYFGQEFFQAGGCGDSGLD